MNKQISISDDDYQEYINKIMIQTTYTKEQCIEKLKIHNNDFMQVIKEYMGISNKKEDKQVKSINQEIFRQIRNKLDNSMKEYRDKNPINIDQVIENLKESDEREKNKNK